MRADTDPKAETVERAPDGRAGVATRTWLPISDAPKDGTDILGRLAFVERITGILRYQRRKTWWGKSSHVPLYGWCVGRDPENIDLWSPTHFQSLPNPPEPSK